MIRRKRAEGGTWKGELMGAGSGLKSPNMDTENPPSVYITKVFFYFLERQEEEQRKSEAEESWEFIGVALL